MFREEFRGPLLRFLRRIGIVQGPIVNHHRSTTGVGTRSSRFVSRQHPSIVFVAISIIWYSVLVPPLILMYYVMHLSVMALFCAFAVEILLVFLVECLAVGLKYLKSAAASNG